MSRNTSTSKQEDALAPKAIASEYKFNRHGDFKKLANDALAPNASPDVLKKLKAGLRESITKGRERVKIFSEGVSAVNKCFPHIPTKQRSRPNGLSGVSRMGPPNVIDVNLQKAEERGINTAPNKRTRTSKVDVRPSAPARLSVSVEKDREALRGPTSNSVQGEDRVLPIVADGWENAKMKRKRSVIKADAASSTSSVSSKSNDGYREPKQGLYPRNLPDSMSRPTDTFGSRPGAASISAHSFTSKPKQESKNIKAVNKIGVREEYTAGGPSNAKLHAPARGPRSGSMVVARFSTVRATASNDQKLPNTASKNGGPVGPTNRKRTQPARSSSPPVTQWTDRRPPKIPRTARRTNIVPVVPSNDDIPSLDSGTKNSSGFAKRVPVNSPSSTSSEIKGSGATKFRQNVQKVSNFVPLTKKKPVNGNDRKTGRGVATARFSAPVEMPQQLSTAKLSLDKPKSVRSKPARPHTRRPSDRKANSRPKPTSVGPAVQSQFWNQIEPLFSLPSDTDISYLKQQGSIQSVVPTTKPDVDSSGDIPLCQRLLSALIPEEGDDNENDDSESNGYGPFYGYGKKSARGFHNEPVCSVSDYHTMSMDNRLLLELQSIGLCPELMPNAVQKVDDDIDGLISDLGNKYHEQVSRKASVLDKLLKTTTEAKALQEKESKQDSVEDDEPPLDFSHLEIPEMDVLGDAFGEQSQDLDSWLNIIDDTILQDDDFMGLEIPMDDLSDIMMTV